MVSASSPGHRVDLLAACVRMPFLSVKRKGQAAELRIHDILVNIRIRGSMPLTNRAGSRSCYFRH